MFALQVLTDWGQVRELRWGGTVVWCCWVRVGGRSYCWAAVGQIPQSSRQLGLPHALSA